ncbi:hypothetical protein D770_23040 [Flammeovirgaceae bacterium 311]|nr:hypothetical protein D770_23040 [Flammeovirgaceae bacterium 311]
MKRKFFSLINILGLATGMAICLLIVLFVQSELGYDQHHEKADRIHRVALERIYPGRSSFYAMIPASIGEAIETEFPEVEQRVRIFNFTGDNNFYLKVGEQVYEDKNVFAADSNFFEVFSADFIAGDRATALKQPNSIVLNRSTAKRMFGTAEQAIGKQVSMDGDEENNSYQITAVVEDWPENSHFTFNILISSAGFQGLQNQNYINFSAHTYLLLQPNASAAALEAKLPVVIEKYVAGAVSQNFNQSWKDFQAAGNGYRYFLQPLQDIHLHSDLEAELGVNGSVNSIYIFSVVAVFILFLACINFINLSTAQSMERAKEVGIRKTFGSEKQDIIGQFLMESTLISLLALLVAFFIILLLLPVFNDISGKQLSILDLLQPLNLLLMLLFATVVGIVAGLYPAFVLSSFKPITVLKGRFKSNKYGLALRNGLVVFQFAISVVLIIAAMIVNQQMDYMLGDSLGFRKELVLMIDRTDLLQQQGQAFKAELAAIPGVSGVAATTAIPGQSNFFGATLQPVGSTEQLTGRGIMVDEEFLNVLDLELVEGRFFSKSFGTDSMSVVINEKAAKDLGLTNPVGARVHSVGDFFNAPDGSFYDYTIVGVVKDFHFQSLHQKIAPLAFFNLSKFGNATPVTTVRLQGDNLQATLKKIDATWSSFIKDRPITYSFLDETLAQQYLSEQRAQKVFSIFSSLAIFIACIGLLGLVAYTTQQRIREISIRKTLGASAGNIINLLLKDFMKLILIASVLAFPVAWWGMNKWLQDFAYRIDVEVWVFIAAGIAATLVAFLTISFQAVKAATANPIKNLRTE